MPCYPPLTLFARHTHGPLATTSPAPKVSTETHHHCALGVEVQGTFVLCGSTNRVRHIVCLQGLPHVLDELLHAGHLLGPRRMLPQKKEGAWLSFFFKDSQPRWIYQNSSREHTHLHDDAQRKWNARALLTFGLLLVLITLSGYIGTKCTLSKHNEC